jgi:hypothetical protein
MELSLCTVPGTLNLDFLYISFVVCTCQPYSLSSCYLFVLSSVCGIPMSSIANSGIYCILYGKWGGGRVWISADAYKYGKCNKIRQKKVEVGVIKGQIQILVEQEVIWIVAMLKKYTPGCKYRTEHSEWIQREPYIFQFWTHLPASHSILPWHLGWAESPLRTMLRSWHWRP